METRNSKNISGLIMAKCGHVVHEHAEWLTYERGIYQELSNLVLMR
jgi:hypothetical protein